MLYEEYIEMLNKGFNGDYEKYNGNIVWLSSFYYNDINKEKPARNIKAEPFIIQRQWESKDFRFHKIDKMGLPKEECIYPQYSSSRKKMFSDYLYVFDNEQEAQNQYNKSCEAAIREIDDWIKSLENKKQDIKNRKL